ncbi:MAG: HAD-IB family hydrolase [Deltaproteobacteria bacterium]|nr:HAD-IB family hydrolase [Deltaproteobacteria bacterium]
MPIIKNLAQENLTDKDLFSKRTIAVFDFDGTLTKKDSFLDFLIYSFGIYKAIKNFIGCSFTLLAYMLGIVSNHTAKERVFKSFFKGYPYPDFVKLCERYSLYRIDEILCQNAISKVKWHLSEGHTLVLVSASIKEWVYPWAKKMGFKEIITTEPEVKNGYLTGMFSTPNCYGEEKKRRFLEKFKDRSSYILYVYGDSKGDIPLLKIADRAFYRRF